MKQHTHTRTRSHRQRTHRGASGIGSSLACGGIKYDMRLAGTVTSPTVSQCAASAAVSLCLALLGASSAPPHRILERLAAAAAAAVSLASCLPPHFCRLVSCHHMGWQWVVSRAPILSSAVARCRTPLSSMSHIERRERTSRGLVGAGAASAPSAAWPWPVPCPSRCRRAMHAPSPKPRCRGGQLSSQPPSRRGRCWRGDGRGMPPRWRSAARPATGARPGFWRLL